MCQEKTPACMEHVNMITSYGKAPIMNPSHHLLCWERGFSALHNPNQTHSAEIRHVLFDIYRRADKSFVVQ